MTTFYYLTSRLPQPGGPGFRIYIPQEQGGPVITQGPGFRFHRLIRLAGLCITRALDTRYIFLGRIQQKTMFPSLSQQYLNCSLFVCRRSVFTETLPSSERLLWIRYFGFQASCHNIVKVLAHSVHATCSVYPNLGNLIYPKTRDKELYSINQE
jgi:hypothetical protein